MVRKTFGEELDDVLGSSHLSVDEVINHPGVHREFQYLFAHEIIPGTYQPRRDFDETTLRELANSIEEKGILQPLIVRKAGKEYELIAGERRWRAAQLAGLKQIPVIVCEIDNNAALAFSLIENIQRQNLNIIEEAIALKRLLEEFSMTHDEIAKSIGKSRAMVTNILRLLNLADGVKELLIIRKLDMGHARALLSLDKGQQIILAEKIVAQNLTVRDVERLVNKIINHNEQEVEISSEIKLKTNMLAKQLGNKLSTRVNINANNSWKGRATIYFESEDELIWIVEQINSIVGKK